MIWSTRVLRGALGAGLLVAGLAACGEDDADIVNPPITGGELFRSYVALGNSITAGYQAGGISDSTQRESYAYLLATQMYGADVGRRWHYPALAGIGCPPPINNIQTQSRVGGGTATTCALRDPAGVQTLLNNVAVPGATVQDPTSVRTAASNTLTTLFLGGNTQVGRALQADPTFITAWIGNNDVLVPAVSGIIVPLTIGTGATATVVSPGITTDTIFRSSYRRMVDSLKKAPRLAGGMLIGVVNTANIPVLFPVAALANPAFKAGFDQFTGGATTIDGSCLAAPGNQALISFQIISAIRTFRTTPTAATAHPPIIACRRGALGTTGTTALVGDLYVLDATEQAAITTSVTTWNTFIQATATANGWGYVDPNPILLQLKQSGCIATVPNLASATQTFGACMSLDGVHPARQAHVTFANALITAIKTQYPDASALANVQ